MNRSVICPNCGYKARSEDDPLLTAYNGLGECPVCQIIVGKFEAIKEKREKEAFEQEIKVKSTAFKAFGAIFGTIIGGPIGGGIGYALGSVISKIDKDIFRNKDGYNYQNLSDDELFIISLFSIAAKISKSDGKITRDEINCIDQFMLDILKYDKHQREIAIEIFRLAKDEKSIDLKECACSLARVLDDYDAKVIIYLFFFQLSVCDGYLHPEEDNILKILPTYLNINDDIYVELLNEFIAEDDENDSYQNDSKYGESENKNDNDWPFSGLEQFYIVLGCSPDDSDSEVKKAYRNKCKEYHPDKISGLGLAEEFNRLAEEKMKIIGEAYNAIKEARNMN